MRCLLLIALLLAVSGRGEETAPPTLREKLRVRLVETLPPPVPAKSAEERPEPANPVLVLEPIVVAEPRGVRELGRLLAREKQRQEAEAFSPIKGGTIYRSDRLELGSWWSPATGWQFLKIKW